MANQTVFVLSNNSLDEARRDPEFLDKLFGAIEETVSTHRPADIGVDYGIVMPYHHGYDPTLYLSYGGVLRVVGSTTVEKMPQDADERKLLVESIVQHYTGD